MPIPLHLTYSLVDLSHTLEPGLPTWGEEAFEKKTQFHHQNHYFQLDKIEMDAGVGTHLDVSAHAVEEGKTIEQLPISKFLAPCVVIDITTRAHAFYQLSHSDIEDFEILHGPIPPHHFVMIRTGWERYWDHPEKYINDYHFPSLSEESVYSLLERKIVGIGIDTLSPDAKGSDYPAHRLLLTKEKFIVENAANLKLLPPKGSYILALPLNIKGGSESPIRLVGFIPRD